MTWSESNTAILELKHRFTMLPARTKDNLVEYEKLAKPLRDEATNLHYTRINICISKNYE